MGDRQLAGSATGACVVKGVLGAALPPVLRPADEVYLPVQAPLALASSMAVLTWADARNRFTTEYRHRSVAFLPGDLVHDRLSTLFDGDSVA